MAKATRRRSTGAREPAATSPVARVAVDVPLAHLDRPFDYLVPAEFDGDAVPGCRVRVRFAGQLVGGYLLDRSEASEHPGRLAYLHRIVSPEPVLTAEVAVLARDVADRFAGTLADVLRLAVPPRHARVEAEVPSDRAPGGPAPPDPPAPGPWAAYPDGPSYLAALTRGAAPRAVWTALPGPAWADAIAYAVQATLAGGRGALVVVPDGRDLARVDAAMTVRLGRGRHVALAADLGPQERYRRWLAVRRGHVPAVVGTRAAMFAPVADLGLVVVWDDGDDLHAERRAPYPHARDVLALRAHRSRAGALVGGVSHSTEAAQLLASRWARPLAADRPTVRLLAPRVRPAGEDAELAHDGAARAARLPTLAWRVARDGLREGPVLVQVPRRGYLPALTCGRCRRTARCPSCAGPLALVTSREPPRCRWCGRWATGWGCPGCGAYRVRAQVVGARRTAEELGRAFPSAPVRRSTGEAVITGVGSEPAIVVATPGAEPVAETGYAAALLLDGWALLGRPDLRAAEEAVRRWMNAAALVRPAARGGSVVVLADGGLPPVQALLRWDPPGYARRELAERAELAFPPAVRMASLTGCRDALRDLLGLLELPAPGEVLGPVPLAGDGADEGGPGADAGGETAERALVRVPRTQGLALSRALRSAAAARSARKAPGNVRIQIDPQI